MSLYMEVPHVGQPLRKSIHFLRQFPLRQTSLICNNFQSEAVCVLCRVRPREDEDHLILTQFHRIHIICKLRIGRKVMVDFD